MSRYLVVLLLLFLAAPAVAQETSAELYGVFRYSYNRADAGDSIYWASANNTSLLGARGEVTSGDWAAFFDLQAGVSVDAEASGQPFTQRYYTAGFRGPIGTLSVGRHSTAYKLPGLRVDPFYDLSSVSVAGGVPTSGAFGGASFGLSQLNNGWSDRAIAYTSPSWRGLVANAALYLDTEADPDYGLGVTYRQFGLDVGIQYHGLESDGRNWAGTAPISSAVRGHARYEGATWSVGTSYERLNARENGHQDYIYASATVDPISWMTLAGAVGHVPDQTLLAPSSGTGFHGGIFVTPFTPITVHMLYSYVDVDDQTDRGNLSLGVSYSFTISSR